MTIVERITGVLERERIAGGWIDHDVAIQVLEAVCRDILERAIDAAHKDCPTVAAACFGLLTEIAPPGFPREPMAVRPSRYP